MRKFPFRDWEALNVCLRSHSTFEVKNLLQSSCKHRNCKQRVLEGAHCRTSLFYTIMFLNDVGNCRLQNYPILSDDKTVNNTFSLRSSSSSWPTLFYKVVHCVFCIHSINNCSINYRFIDWLASCFFSGIFFRYILFVNETRRISSLLIVVLIVPFPSVFLSLVSMLCESRKSAKTRYDMRAYRYR